MSTPDIKPLDENRKATSLRQRTEEKIMSDMIGSRLNLDDVIYVAKVYRMLQAKFSIQLACEALGITKKTVRDIQERVHRALKCTELFWSQNKSGENASAIESETNEYLIQHFERIAENILACNAVVNRGGSEISRGTVVRIGASLELCRNWLHEWIRDFRILHPNLDFSTDIDWDQPQKLRQRGIEKGEFDFVLTSYEERGELESTKDLRLKIIFPLHLLVDRRFKMPHSDHNPMTLEELESCLPKMTLVVQGDRHPLPKVSYELLHKAARVVHTSSYTAAYSMVLASGGEDGVCCMGIPQLLSENERNRLRSFECDPNVSVHVGLFRPVATRTCRSISHNNLCDELENYLKERLNRLTQTEVKLIEFPRFKGIWNVARQEDQYYWLEGTIDNFVISPDGSFRADHIVNWKDPVRFSIMGRVSQDPAKKSIHVVWRGWDRIGNVPENVLSGEVYAASVIGTSEHFLDSPFVHGFWMGRDTLANEYVPGAGLLLLAKEKATQEDCHQYMSKVLESAQQRDFVEVVKKEFENPCPIRQFEQE